MEINKKIIQRLYFVSIYKITQLEDNALLVGILLVYGGSLQGVEIVPFFLLLNLVKSFFLFLQVLRSPTQPTTLTTCG